MGVCVSDGVTLFVGDVVVLAEGARVGDPLPEGLVDSEGVSDSEGELLSVWECDELPELDPDAVADCEALML